ncbi:serine/threonine-protein kinase [Streptomyces sp. CBMA123]|uniref:serine/threonine-protein kinase n=1 Tax=Streptomyces sp. CBMA123 TaxID=1896313 RepID=UPI001661F8F6|nr:serine/threonine-protein kinase [Streptomyces sp. CBMA123]
MTEEAIPGRLVGRRYRLLRQLGAGGFGRVWQAHDETLGIDVAVKQLWLPPATSEGERAERLARAEREARNAARLRDRPHIVAVHDVLVEDGMPWMVMQLVSGGSLGDRLAAHGPLPVERAAVVARALLTALGAAHAAGVVHRDVKPANVMLADDGDVLLADFGIAVHEADSTLTVTGAFVGSIEYIAPERARGVDGQAASDLFSLGVTLYQAVEGVSPFRRESATASLTAVLFDPPEPPRNAGRLAPLILALLAKDPEQRPGTAQALAMLDQSVPDRPTALDQPLPAPAPATALDHPFPAAPAEDEDRADQLGVTSASETPASRPYLTIAVAVAVVAVLAGAIWLLAASRPGDGKAKQPATGAGAAFPAPPSGSPWRGPSPSPSVGLPDLPTPCDIPSATVDKLRLTNHGKEDVKPERRRCDWWTDGSAQLPYNFASAQTYRTGYSAHPGSHPVRVADAVTAQEYIDKFNDPHMTLCRVEWSTANGGFASAVVQASNADDSSHLCEYAEQWANGLYQSLPH